MRSKTLIFLCVFLLAFAGCRSMHRDLFKLISDTEDSSLPEYRSNQQNSPNKLITDLDVFGIPYAGAGAVIYGIFATAIAAWQSKKNKRTVSFKIDD